jgi:hypothetical protein
MFQQGELGTSEHDRVVLNHDHLRWLHQTPTTLEDSLCNKTLAFQE